MVLTPCLLAQFIRTHSNLTTFCRTVNPPAFLTYTHFPRALSWNNRPGQNQICTPFLFYKTLTYSKLMPACFQYVSSIPSYFSWFKVYKFNNL